MVKLSIFCLFWGLLLRFIVSEICLRSKVKELHKFCIIMIWQGTQGYQATIPVLEVNFTVNSLISLHQVQRMWVRCVQGQRSRNFTKSVYHEMTQRTRVPQASAPIPELNFTVNSLISLCHVQIIWVKCVPGQRSRNFTESVYHDMTGDIGPSPPLSQF